MSYKNLMVSLDLTAEAGHRVELAAGLAKRFQARLIGIAGRRYEYIPFEPLAYGANTIMLDELERRIAADLRGLEQRFRDIAGMHNSLEWRFGSGQPVALLAREARAADLVILARQNRQDEQDPLFSVDPGEAVMALGRPILVVPPNTTTLVAKQVVVAWKDTREARRAVRDALPFLKVASEVVVVGVGAPNDANGAQDVANYLQHHGISASAAHRPGDDAKAANAVLDVVAEACADLLVMGAYGHSRTREWILGGVTHELLSRTPVCCLMAH
ncbi:universal stress protein [Rhodoligotrophos ferricapiens]|uniref:universal stress protein n=1 Tax=Rhodoligotrophos ferricapiens TaxID=3069264 RepID=UPI00315D0315